MLFSQNESLIKTRNARKKFRICAPISQKSSALSLKNLSYAILTFAGISTPTLYTLPRGSSRAVLMNLAHFSTTGKKFLIFYQFLYKLHIDKAHRGGIL